MNRLQAELHRLYLPRAPGQVEHGPDPVDLVGADGRVRALVLELASPAGWPELSAVWRGVQTDLELPAPAIAVSGADRYQLWFSLREAVQVDQAVAFLDGVRSRYLGAVPPERISTTPSGAMVKAGQELRTLPPAQVAPERWSAFVAPDLAPLFADEPSLDHPPGADAQADLLSRLEPTAPDGFVEAMKRLTAEATPPLGSTVQGGEARAPTPAGPALDPRSFLLDVMRDPTVDLPLRIEAAKALLPYVDSERRSL